MTILKIISGGQTGAERAALDAAIEYGIPHGGWVTKGRMAEDGKIPYKYKLRQMPSESYPERIEKNIMDSEGTVMISHGKLTADLEFVQDCAQKYTLPYVHIDLNKILRFLAASEVNIWVTKNIIEVINVVGSRKSIDPEIYRDTKYIIERAILLGSVEVAPDKHILDCRQKEYLEDLLAPPKNVHDAADRLIKDMTLKEKVNMANMEIEDLMKLHISIRRYIQKTFNLPENKELIESCLSNSKVVRKNENEAAVRILLVSYNKLRSDYKLRVIK